MIRDDPSLLPRPDRGRRPWRVVADPHGRTPASAKILRDGAVAQTLIAVGPDCDPARAMSFLRCGASVAVVDAAPDGRLAIRALLDHLGKLGVLRVFCEGGAELAASMLDARAADELLFFYAPRVLGGRAAVPAVGGAGRALGAALGYRITETFMAGPDVVVRARPE